MKASEVDGFLQNQMPDGSIKKMVMPEEDQPGSDGQKTDEPKVSDGAAKEIEIKDQITKEKNNVIKE